MLPVNRYNYKRNFNNKILFGGVAHRLEQAAHNRLVVGSIPTSPTKPVIFVKTQNIILRNFKTCL